MKLRHRRCFVVVAEAGSLMLAAERKLHTSQPSLSRRVGLLKTRSAQLLTRGARGMELGPARRYVKLGFGGAHTDSNQRLMYTSA
jgi:LysR family hca operon transcriptional activator